MTRAEGRSPAVHEEGVELMVLSLAGPYKNYLSKLHPGLEWNPARTEERLAAIAGPHQVKLLSAKPELTRVKEAGTAVIFPRDGHLNPEGHRIVAFVLYAGLAERLRTPGSRPPTR